jgi:hypothetical protein
LFYNKDCSFLFNSVMRVYRTLVPTMQQRINKIVELIYDIENPTALVAGVNRTVMSAETTTNTSTI